MVGAVSNLSLFTGQGSGVTSSKLDKCALFKSYDVVLPGNLTPLTTGENDVLLKSMFYAVSAGCLELHVCDVSVQAGGHVFLLRFVVYD